MWLEQRLEEYLRAILEIRESSGKQSQVTYPGKRQHCERQRCTKERRHRRPRSHLYKEYRKGQRVRFEGLSWMPPGRHSLSNTKVRKTVRVENFPSSQSMSPLAISVQTRTYWDQQTLVIKFERKNRKTSECNLTIAIHLAIPTKINPSLNSLLSGKKAQLSANITKGAIIQLTAREKARWYQIWRPVKSRYRAEGDTRQRMGHIIKMRATAIDNRMKCIIYFSGK